MSAPNQQMQVNVNRKDIIEAENIVCDKCGSPIFKPAMVLKKVPGVVLGMGVEPIAMPIEVMVCNQCGELAPTIKEEKSMEFILTGKPKIETKSGLIL